MKSMLELYKSRVHEYSEVDYGLRGAVLRTSTLHIGTRAVVSTLGCLGASDQEHYKVKPLLAPESHRLFHSHVHLLSLERDPHQVDDLRQVEYRKETSQSTVNGSVHSQYKGTWTKTYGK